MGMSRTEKETEVKALNERFANDELVVVTQYSGLTVKEMSNLRAKLREQGAQYKVTKNSLAKIAIKGTRFEPISDLFTGPTGMATSTDPVAAAKGAYDFAKTNDKLIIVGGALGDKILDEAAIKELASLPSVDEIRSKLVGLLVAAPTKLVGLLQAPARDMVGVTKAYGEKSE